MEKKVASVGWGSFFWGIPAFLWQVLFFYIPFFFLIVTSFIKHDAATESFRFTLEHYSALCSSIYLKIVFRSLFMAISTVLMCLLIAYPVAYYLAIKVKRWKSFFFALLVLPFWTNFLLLVYAWYFLLENDGLVNSLLLWSGFITEPIAMMNTKIAVHCGMFYCYLPFMILPLYSAFERLDLKLLEASSDLGATDFQTFFRITLPLTFSGIQTGALLVFIPSFGDFVVPALLGGDKDLYIGSVITHYFLTVRNISMGSAFTCFATILLILLLLFFFVMHATLFSKDKNNA
jgi:spermidine/putrescine transport system permease protein